MLVAEDTSIAIDFFIDALEKKFHFAIASVATGAGNLDVPRPRVCEGNAAGFKPSSDASRRKPTAGCGRNCYVDSAFEGFIARFVRRRNAADDFAIPHDFDSFKRLTANGFAVNVQRNVGRVSGKVFTWIAIVNGNEQHGTRADETAAGFESPQPGVVAETIRQVDVHAAVA